MLEDQNSKFTCCITINVNHRVFCSSHSLYPFFTFSQIIFPVRKKRNANYRYCDYYYAIKFNEHFKMLLLWCKKTITIAISMAIIFCFSLSIQSILRKRFCKPLQQYIAVSHIPYNTVINLIDICYITCHIMSLKLRRRNK